MKHFLYTITEKTVRNGYTTSTLRLYEVKRNAPKLIHTYRYQFESPDQACYNAIEEAKVLPQKFLDLALHPMGGRDHKMLQTRCKITKIV